MRSSSFGWATSTSSSTRDAVIAARALDITLTARGKNTDGTMIPMAGVPHHAASAYLARLIEQGFRVAICEQMVDPSTVKGVVPREICSHRHAGPLTRPRDA